MLTIRHGEKEYAFDEIAALESLTGEESAAVEDFLGGWHRFRDNTNRTRTVIVMVWLAKRSAGEQVTLDDVAKLPGLIFGANAPEIVEPAPDEDDPMRDPGRPLAETNGAHESTAGSGASDSSSTPETSAVSGPHLSDVSTA